MLHGRKTSKGFGLVVCRSTGAVVYNAQNSEWVRLQVISLEGKILSEKGPVGRCIED